MATNATTSSTSGAGTTTLEATFTRVIWQKPDNAWGVGVFTDSDRASHKVSGGIGQCTLGKTYRMDGRLEETPYGKTFKALTVVAVEPRSADAVQAYLETLPGIGERSAMAIVTHYGPENAIRALEQDDLDQIKEKTGIRLSAEKLVELRLAIDAERSSREINLQVRKLLGDLATDKLVAKILEEWGETAPSLIARNPWVLTDLNGIGWLKADRCAQQIGSKMTSQDRIKACLLYALEEQRNSGHTRCHAHSLFEEAIKLLGFRDTKESMGLVMEGAMQLCEGDNPTLVEIDATYLQLRSDYRNEQVIAEMLAARAKPDPDHGEFALVPFLDCEPPAGLFPDQVEALATMVAAGPGGTCLLTGAPGTGKTTMVRAFFGRFREADIALCAPTGKAAKRLSQQAGMIATTVHRLLEPSPTTDAKGKTRFSFAKGEQNKIEKRLVVVDEASMVDAALFRSLLAAIPRCCYLLIVGDPNQLPSVSPGSVLRDLIESKAIPHAHLTQIKRTNPGLLLTSIHSVKDGRWSRFANDPANDMFLVSAQTDNDAVKAMADLYLERLPALLAKLTLEGGDPVQDIQLLVPWRAKEGLSARTVNLEIQRRRAAAGKVQLGGKWPLGVGDKVIQQKNDYQLNIVNGDQGVITDMVLADDANGIERWVYVVAFAGYDLPVQVPAIGNDLDLSYAVTVHKSQGSEWPVIVLPAMQTNSPFYDRTLLYTAMSRAQKALVIVGAQEGLQRVVDRVSAERRRTGLQQAIKSS